MVVSRGIGTTKNVCKQSGRFIFIFAAAKGTTAGSNDQLQEAPVSHIGGILRLDGGNRKDDTFHGVIDSG